jgi:hypothetical protein
MNFIESYRLVDTQLCDKIVEWFEENKELQEPGKSGSDATVDIEIKDSTDITFSCPLAKDYAQYLHKFIDKYKKKYVHCTEGHAPWSIYPIVNIQRYLPGQYYKKLHFENDGLGRANRRHLVFMTYLNDVDDGGETFFYYQDLKVKPRKGLTLIWPAGWTHTHCGLVSNTQSKYIVTGWISYEPHEPFFIIN